MTYRTVEAGDWIARQPKAVQEAGEARGADLIREVTLREVREAVKRTQVEVAAAMGTSQDRVSKLERGDDALVSTLRRHVRALGGELRLMVEFPDRPSMAIDLHGLRDYQRFHTKLMLGPFMAFWEVVETLDSEGRSTRRGYVHPDQRSPNGGKMLIDGGDQRHELPWSQDVDGLTITWCKDPLDIVTYSVAEIDAAIERIRNLAASAFSRP